MEKEKTVTQVQITDKKIFVRHDYGPWYEEEIASPWLWVLGFVAFGETRIEIDDERKNRDPHQKDMTSIRNVSAFKQEGTL